MHYSIPKILLISVIILLSACSPTEKVNVAAFDTNDNLVQIPAVNGNWTVINYWASWCGPCRKEIPELNAINANSSVPVTVIGVNADNINQDILKQTAEEMGVEFATMRQDPIKIVGYALQGVPSTYIISPKGRLYGPLLGEQSADSIMQAIASYS